MNEINLAVIGIRGQEVSHQSIGVALKDNRNVRTQTLCDADEQYFFPDRNQRSWD